MTTLEIRRSLITTQVLCLPVAAQAQFRELVDEEGCDPSLALMVVSKKAPGTGLSGDRLFNEQARHRMETISPKLREKILKAAKKAGISTQGKYYCGGLGRYNDPAAWVSTTDDVMAVAKAKELIVNGVVNHDPGETKSLEREKPAIHPKVRDELMQKKILGDQKLQEQMKKAPKKTIAGLREEITEKHGKKK